MRRALRSVLLIVIFTVGALYSTHGAVSGPLGNPLLYALAMLWLISMTVAVLTSAIFVRLNPKLFSLAPWENDGDVYDRGSIRGFRWVLLHSPLGWINPNLHLSASRTDCDRLLREMNASEGLHWLTCVFAIVLGISYLVGEHVVYGYVMPLVRIPFDPYPIMLQRWNRGRLCRVLSRGRAPATTRYNAPL